MFSFSCITIDVPHPLPHPSPLFFRFPAASWLSLSPTARWELRAKLIYLFVVETPRASATGYWSAHEKFSAGYNKLAESKMCVTLSRRPFWEQRERPLQKLLHRDIMWRRIRDTKLTSSDSLYWQQDGYVALDGETDKMAAIGTVIRKGKAFHPALRSGLFKDEAKEVHS